MSVALVLALATLGVANTLWFENLFVTGTVETGVLSGEWSNVFCSDVEPKDVGSTTGTIVDATHLEFAIENAYPQYVGDCEVEYMNSGTIPVHVDYITMTPGDDLTNCVCTQQSTGTTTCACDQLQCRWVNGLCSQLHPGDEQAASLRCTLLQPAAMGATYNFDLVLGLVQYNESSCPPR